MVSRRFLQLASCLLPLVVAPTARSMAQELETAKPANIEAISIESNQQIEVELDRVLKKYQLPALWAGRFQADGKSGLAAKGVRKWGARSTAEISDTVHIGSCTKAMTGLLIAQLISEGKLQFTTQVKEIFPETTGLAESAWGKVTVNELLQHRSGAPANADWDKLHNLHPTDLQAGRQATLEWLLKSKRPKQPGFVYSNVGFVVLGHIVEKLRGESWEVTIRNKLFEPLQINSAGFGPVGSEESNEELAAEKSNSRSAIEPEFPYGHTLQVSLGAQASKLFGMKSKLAFDPTQIDNPAVINPAGRVHLQIGEWSRFVLLFANSEPPTELGISDAVWKELRAAKFGGEYAGGWVVEQPKWAKEKLLWHNGSNTTWYCMAYAVPEQACCLIAVTNAYCPQAERACEDMIEVLSKIKL